jgi:predicted ArsR family transcriptional regulator
LRHLSGTLQDVVGLDEAAGFISIVGQKMGDDINQGYCRALDVSSLNRQQVAAAMVDLKQRIKGDFSLVSEDAKKIVVQTTSCPFAEKVIGRPSLCMMTSNVFGTIAAENLGYAKVHLAKTIAMGDAGCLIEVYLQHNDEAEASPGNEYYKG